MRSFYQTTLFLLCFLAYGHTAQAQVSPDSTIHACPVQTMPEFVGGQRAMHEFIRKNLRIPASIRAEKIACGRVYVRFLVGKDGKIRDVKVIKGLRDCPECDAEVIRLIESMPDWTPGKVNGNLAEINFTLPIILETDR